MFKLFWANSKEYNVGSYGECMFSFIWNHQTVFQNGWATLLFHEQWRRVPIVLHPPQSLVFSLFWNDHSSRCVVAKHYCFNLHFPDDICEALFVICMSSLVACLFRSLAHFKNKVACFLIVEFYKLFIYSG